MKHSLILSHRRNVSSQLFRLSFSSVIKPHKSYHIIVRITTSSLESVLLMDNLIFLLQLTSFNSLVENK